VAGDLIELRRNRLIIRDKADPKYLSELEPLDTGAS
jgi:hypothetical protein